MSKYDDEDFFGHKASKKQTQRRQDRKEKEAAKQAKRAGKRQQRQKRRHTFIIAACFVFLLAAAAVVAASAMNVFELQRSKAEAQAQLDDLDNTKGALEEELAQVESDEYVEQQARSELRMIKDGEVLYVIRDGQEEEEGPRPEGAGKP